ncbi:MAG: ATP-binding protein [Anaerolineae bacterium]
MDILQEAIVLLTEPPGDLVYFLVTFFALQQTWFSALTARRRSPDAPLARRWFWASSGILAGRVGLIALSLLGSAGVLDPVLLLPPLERGLEVAAIALVIWATLGDRAAAWHQGVLSVALLAAVGFYVYALRAWAGLYAAGAPYHGSQEELIWEIAALSLLGLGLLLQLLLRPPEWEWAIALFLFWAAGHTAQLVWPTSELYVSDWERLSALLVFPMLAVYVHRRLTGAPLPAVPAESVTTGTGAASPTLDFAALQTLLEGVETARELEPSLLIASSQLARLLDAEICAVALMTEGGDADTLRVVATHPPTGDLEPPVLRIAEHETLERAWAESGPCTFEEMRAERLAQVLGFEAVEPLLLLPMRVHTKHIGLLLLGRPESGRPWQPSTVEAARLTALLLAGAIDRVQRRGGSIFSLREQEGDLQESLTEARSEVAALQKHVADLQDEVNKRDRDIVRLRRELEQRSEHVSETELKFWQSEIKSLAEERDKLIKERNQLSTELARFRSRLKALVQERTALRARLEAVQQEVEAGRSKGGAVGIIVADETGVIRLADALARRLLALPEGEVMGSPLDGAYPDPTWTQAVDYLLTRDASVTLPPTHLTLQVREETVEADLVRLTGRNGRPDGIVVTLRSETSLAEQQEALIGLANEFRTPMTSILGYTDLLLGEQAGILTEMQQQFLERVKASTEQLNHLLNDFIRLASPDARRVDLSPQPVNLVAIIERAIVGLSARFRERRLTIEMDLPEALPPVRVDRDSLYQIMLRLLSNAAVCSREGSEIVVSAALEDGADDTPPFVRISVTDTGGGIAPEDLPKVFRRFFRARQPLIEGLGERGVGMAIAKTLVEANGGRIWVDTEPNEGSTFSFVLPAHLQGETEAA